MLKLCNHEHMHSFLDNFLPCFAENVSNDGYFSSSASVYYILNMPGKLSRTTKQFLLEITRRTHNLEQLHLRIHIQI